MKRNLTSLRTDRRLHSALGLVLLLTLACGSPHPDQVEGAESQGGGPALDADASLVVGGESGGPDGPGGDGDAAAVRELDSWGRVALEGDRFDDILRASRLTGAAGACSGESCPMEETWP
jgi:hypothetical protein